MIFCYDEKHCTDELCIITLGTCLKVNKVHIYCGLFCSFFTEFFAHVFCLLQVYLKLTDTSSLMASQQNRVFTHRRTFFLSSQKPVNQVSNLKNLSHLMISSFLKPPHIRGRLSPISINYIYCNNKKVPKVPIVFVVVIKFFGNVFFEMPWSTMNIVIIQYHYGLYCNYKLSYYEQ